MPWKIQTTVVGGAQKSTEESTGGHCVVNSPIPDARLDDIESDKRTGNRQLDETESKHLGASCTRGPGVGPRGCDSQDSPVTTPRHASKKGLPEAQPNGIESENRAVCGPLVSS